MKNRKTALLCLALCLLVLFGCAQEAGIPEGWVEYDLPEAGVKIALPPEYVLAAKELMPTDADYERAGISTSMQEYFATAVENVFDDPYVRIWVMSAKNENLIVGGVFMRDVPDEVEWLGTGTTTLSNIKQYSKFAFELYKGEDVNYYKADGIVVNERLCYAVVEREYTTDYGFEDYERICAALFEGKRIEIVWTVEKKLADVVLIGEFDDITKTFYVE